MGKQGIKHNQLYFLYNNKLYLLLKIENNIIEAIDIDKNKIKINIIYVNDKIQFISVSEQYLILLLLFSCSVMSDTLRPHGL